MNREKEQGEKNIMWCIWQHPDSPLFGKDKMATFGAVFYRGKRDASGEKNPYYELLEKEEVVDEILKSSTAPGGSLTCQRHVPCKMQNGESPIKRNGKVLVIDGGFPGRNQKERPELEGIPLSTTPMVLFSVAHEPLSRKEARWKREAIFIRIGNGSETGDRNAVSLEIQISAPS